jgi:hypothetical protein
MVLTSVLGEKEFKFKGDYQIYALNHWNWTGVCNQNIQRPKFIHEQSVCEETNYTLESRLWL